MRRRGSARRPQCSSTQWDQVNTVIERAPRRAEDSSAHAYRWRARYLASGLQREIQLNPVTDTQGERGLATEILRINGVHVLRECELDGPDLVRSRAPHHDGDAGSARYSVHPVERPGDAGTPDTASVGQKFDRAGPPSPRGVATDLMYGVARLLGRIKL